MNNIDRILLATKRFLGANRFAILIVSLGISGYGYSQERKELSYDWNNLALSSCISDIKFEAGRVKIYFRERGELKDDIKDYAKRVLRYEGGTFACGGNLRNEFLRLYPELLNVLKIKGLFAISDNQRSQDKHWVMSAECTGEKCESNTRYYLNLVNDKIKSWVEFENKNIALTNIEEEQTKEAANRIETKISEINDFYSCVNYKSVSDLKFGLNKSKIECKSLMPKVREIIKNINHEEIVDAKRISDDTYILICKTSWRERCQSEAEDFFKPISNIWKQNKEKEAAQLESKRLTHLNLLKITSIDVVSKVLNYSSGCDDLGCEYSTWIPEDAGKCKYIQIRKSDGELLRNINLNEFDPKSIKIVEKIITKPVIDSSILNGQRSIINVTTNVQNIEYQGAAIFSSGNRDLDRLKRGWNLIYREYCKGTVKEF